MDARRRLKRRYTLQRDQVESAINTAPEMSTIPDGSKRAPLSEVPSNEVVPEEARQIRRGRKNKNGIGAEAILDAVKALLRTPHLEPLTQAAIAKAAGVDDKMIRYHFGDVDALLDRLTTSMIAEFSERMSQASRAGASATQRIHARIGAHIGYLRENPKSFWLIFERFYRRNDEASRIASAEFNKSSLKRLEDVVRAGRREGSLRKQFDPRLLYLALIGMTSLIGQAHSIVQVLYEGESLEDFDREYQDFVFELVLSGVGQVNASNPQPPTLDMRLQDLTEENARLRDMLADCALEVQRMKGRDGSGP